MTAGPHDLSCCRWYDLASLRSVLILRNDNCPIAHPTGPVRRGHPLAAFAFDVLQPLASLGADGLGWPWGHTMSIAGLVGRGDTPLRLHVGRYPFGLRLCKQGRRGHTTSTTIRYGGCIPDARVVVFPKRQMTDALGMPRLLAGATHWRHSPLTCCSHSLHSRPTALGTHHVHRWSRWPWGHTTSVACRSLSV